MVLFEKKVSMQNVPSKHGIHFPSHLVCFGEVLLLTVDLKKTREFLNKLPVMNDSKYRAKGTAMTEDPQKSSCC